MYYQYWNLTKAPFDNVPDPSMYTDCHSSMENALAETLFAIEEGEDCFAVIVGDVGLGKTLSIRMVIDSLNQEEYKIALITNPSLTFVQLLREMIGQLTGKQCEEKKKVDLLEIFNKFLFETYDEGKKILILIDEANVISRKNLENLRLLTNMQNDERNLFTMVLAGQIELAKRLEHPTLANLFQRVGTYCRIEKIETEDLVKSYVEARLNLSGCNKKIFTDDAINLIWKHSENGVPRLINKICKLSLKAGETNKLTEINGDIVEQVGSRFMKTTSIAAPIRTVRRRAVNRTENFDGNVTDNRESIKSNSYYSKFTVPVVNNNQEIERNNVENIKPVYPEMQYEDNFEKKLDNNSVEINIGQRKVKICLPASFIQQAIDLDLNDRMKQAGAMAAKIVKENPKLTGSYLDDPVSIWGDLRDTILNKIESQNMAV